jgi:hypothetical protein
MKNPISRSFWVTFASLSASIAPASTLPVASRAVYS